MDVHDPNNYKVFARAQQLLHFKKVRLFPNKQNNLSSLQLVININTDLIGRNLNLISTEVATQMDGKEKVSSKDFRMGQ